MKSLVESLSPAQMNMWNSILSKKISQTLDKKPNAPVAEVYSDAWTEFNTGKWVSYIDQDKIHYSLEEYEEMHAIEYGPDLTAISRKRFASCGARIPKGPVDKSERKHTPYQMFVKDNYRAIKENSENHDMKSADILRTIGQKWNQLPKEEREHYGKE